MADFMTKGTYKLVIVRSPGNSVIEVGLFGLVDETVSTIVTTRFVDTRGIPLLVNRSHVLLVTFFFGESDVSTHS